MSQVEIPVPDAARHGVITVGNFDGVHRGHQQMLTTLRQIAAAQNAAAVVVTFDPHPLSLLRPDDPLPRLTSIRRRTELLKHYGADAVVVLPVTRALLNMTADEFFQQVIVQQLSAVGVVEGPNFHFGRNRGGDVDYLHELCRSAGITFQVIDAVQEADQLISSSRIRVLLEQGQVLKAVAMTGHAHRLSGHVSRGAGRGGPLGFPTANIEDITTMLPANGVYAGTTTVNSTRYDTAVSIGPNPTFEDHRQKVECHLIGYDGDLYGQSLDVDLLAEIRPLCTFDSVEQLQQQIGKDVRQTERCVHQLSQPIYKICTQDEWQQAVSVGQFSGSDADRADGYIHFSTADQVQATAAKHFAGLANLVLVHVDPLLLGPQLKWEPSRNDDLFPHLYDALPVNAATKVDPLPWQNDAHLFPF